MTENWNTNRRESDESPRIKMQDLIFKDEVFRIVGAAMEVYNELKSGFLESIYQEAFQIELAMRGVPFDAQVPLKVFYKEQPLNKFFVADLVCFGKILVELKAVDQTTKRDEAQVLNYLRATGFKLGVLINFGDPGRLDWTRIIL